MQQPAFARRLKAEFPGLSVALREAARWVIDHPLDVALLGTREQARRAGVTPATMTRLAQRFDLGGYDELRRLYADAVRRRPDGFRRRAEALLERRREEGDPALAHDVLAALSGHLRTLATPDMIARLDRAAGRLAAARRVYCLGLRSTFPVAYIFHYIRSLFGEASVLVDGAGGVGSDALRSIDGQDVLLAISVRPYTAQTVKAASYARTRGATIVAITDSTVSPLAGIAGETLVVPTESPSFFHTLTPALAIAETLVALVAARNGSRTLSALAASEEQLNAFDSYVAPVRRRKQAS